MQRWAGKGCPRSEPPNTGWLFAVVNLGKEPAGFHDGRSRGILSARTMFVLPRKHPSPSGVEETGFGACE
jgi:hypothetical protein